MGEGLDRKQVEQFENQRNARLKEASDSLLARIPPGREKQIQVVSAGSALAPDTQLEAKVAEDGSKVQFVANDLVCGSANPEMMAELGVPLESCFFVVMNDEGGVLTMRVCSVDRRVVRPSTEDENRD